MSKPGSAGKSMTDWERVDAMTDADITLTDEHPELSARQMLRGVFRVGLKPVPPKVAISLRIDADVLEWFKSLGPGYQTRINLVLRAFRAEAMAGVDRRAEKAL